ncbi:MAG TPA: cytochrome c/FTR1 family iron permease [Usitatibacter sp.]|nr:cytochrome c/FTR1 family iron permease [Usitatibacter sp.]
MALRSLVAGFALAFAAFGVQASEDGPAMALHLLDYIAADYPNAVDSGRVKSEDEYKEMTEFTGEAARLVKALPDNAAKPALASDADKLVALVAARADAREVARSAGAIQSEMIRAYRIAVAPRHTPDIARGAALFAEQCTSCHGAGGHGDGPAAKGMDPPPADFLDRERMGKRSAFGLYNTVTLGVQGTPMRSFGGLSDDDRWSLAFYVASLPPPAELRAKGESLWKAGKGRAEFASLDPVATLSPNETAARHGDEGLAVRAYLLAHPEAIAATRASPLDFASAKLAEAVAAYRKGERAQASRLAIQAYLEGYELVETSLSNVDSDLMRRGERAMMDVRGAIQSGAPIDAVEAKAKEADEVLAEARDRLSGEALSAPATFTAALVILLREGLEAVLVLAAIFAFLGKAKRGDAKRYVHMGWAAALALGALTWVVSNKIIAISGASREVTEGVTALVSAAMLLYVGFWLHDKSHAQGWQKFINAQVGGALTTGTVWTLATISFLAVYREIFETVLFYEALASQAGPEGHAALMAGVACGALALGVTTWAILRWSARLPLGAFFAGSALLLAVLAVVFTGQGIAALQEASWVDARSLGSVRVPMLGIFPTAQSLGAQAAVAALIVFVLWWSKRSERRA